MNWHKLVIAACTSVLISSAAVAQTKPVAARYAGEWTGFYAGLQAGYGWNDLIYTTSASPEPTSVKSNGFVGGGTVGYNFQSGAFVLGFESDISFADVNGSKINGNNVPCANQGCSAKLDWFSTGRARIGYTIGDFLPYLTGGVAVGGIKGSVDNGPCGNVMCAYDETRGGWTAGGGLEYRFYRNWSLKAEYLYLDLGKPRGPVPSVHISDFAVNMVRGGVNLHF